ncbi:MAG: hypothetical protein ACI8ZO_000973 [Flavobacteriales bacterium]|jgi:hypothetical protein
MKRIFLIATIGFVFVLFGCKTKEKVTQEVVVEQEVATAVEAETKSKSDFKTIKAANTEIELNKDIVLKSQEFIELDSIRFERTSCYGTCPTFIAMLYANGTMKYSGRVFVDHVGLYTANINKSVLKETLLIMKQFKFFNMEESYDGQITDVPSTITEFWHGDTYKKVINRVNGPTELKTIEKHLDYIIEKATDWKQLSK